MYKVRMNESALLTLSGKKLDPATAQIIIDHNWSWLPYTLAYSLSLKEALSNFKPTAGDVIKSQTAFAMYINNGWLGTLTAMEPGRGYIYHSMAATDRYFHYPSGSPALQTTARRAAAAAAAATRP
jgi:hypothetical protein